MVKLNSEMKAGTDAATVTDVQVNHVSQTIAKPIVMRSLQFAGKLALAARLVTTANAKNISQRIEQMETALDVYDNEILSVSNDA